MVARVDCGCPHTSDRAALIAHQAVRVVLEGIAGADESLAVAEDLFELLIRADQLGHVVGVCGQIAQDECTADLLGIHAPLLSFCLDVGFWIAAEAVCVAKVDHVDLADVAALDHGAHLQQEFESGEAVGHADDFAFFLGQFLDLKALLDFEEEGLLADDVEAGFQGCLGCFVVKEVGSRDVDCLDSVGALCLFLEHGLVIGIQTVGIHAEVDAELSAALEINIECRCGQDEGCVVAHSAQAMLVAYVTGGAAAHDTPAERCPFDDFLSDIHI